MGVEVAEEAVTAGEVAVTDWVGEDTLLSGVVTHSADSQRVASVRDSEGREYFPLVDFLFAEMMAVSGITTLGTMGISEIGTYGIAISLTILISLGSVFLIGGTLTTDTSTTDIPTRMRITIPQRLMVTSIGKIWRWKCNGRFPDGATTMARLTE
jgi:hypothetical protein